jgi:5'-phosphate synthase pdxT subunit
VGVLSLQGAVEEHLRMIKKCGFEGISGQKDSLEECERGILNCKNHLACMYLRRSLE